MERLISRHLSEFRRRESGISDLAKHTINSNIVLDYHTTIAFEGIPKHVQISYLDETFPEANRRLVVNFLNDIINHDNLSVASKIGYAKSILYLLRAVNHKPIKDITRDDILSYLHSLRKPFESDIKQSWISTHNVRAVMYLKFFRWVYFPELSSVERRKRTPEVIRDIPLYKKKEKTNVEAKDLWTPREDAVFLTYCEDPRIQFYHMLSLDTSGRPSELLRLRVGDIKIKYAGEKTYAEVSIGRGGKTKSRTVPLIISLPFFKALLGKYPELSNPQYYLFRSHDHKSKYTNKPMQEDSLSDKYRKLKTQYFTKLLERPDISPEDKLVIKDMLQKPWNPYLRRHMALTEKAKILNEYSLRLHAGWTKTSKMVEVYTHELGSESSTMLLEAAGIMVKDPTVMNVLQPKTCTNCSEQNRPTEQYCVKCGFAMNFAAAKKIQEEEAAKADEQKKTIEQLQKDMEMLKRYSMGKMKPKYPQQ